VIKEGGFGFCRTKKNIEGKIHTTVYGYISSLSRNPIEKKPLFHFYPGSYALTAGTYSCNFPCPWCQNWEISKYPPEEGNGRYIAPEEFVELAISSNCQGTSVSFNEPTLLFDWSLELFPLARDRGLYNTFVTNGYMSEEALKRLIQAGLDGANFDLKGNKEVYRLLKADGEIIWRNLKLARKMGLHIEITTLIITGVSDRGSMIREIARRIVDELGPDIPWHLTRYFPAYRYDQPPPPISLLEDLFQVAKDEGIRYLYLGNVPGHRWENTYCPRCNSLLIKRIGRVENFLKDSTCPNCGYSIPLVD